MYICIYIYIERERDRERERERGRGMPGRSVTQILFITDECLLRIDCIAYHVYYVLRFYSYIMPMCVTCRINICIHNIHNRTECI